MKETLHSLFKTIMVNDEFNLYGKRNLNTIEDT